MAIDANLKCSQFRCTMAVSYCSTKCAYPGRAGKQCVDLARYATEKPDDMRAIVLAVHTGKTAQAVSPGAAPLPLSPVFKSAFPDFLPEGVAAAPPAPPAPPAPKPKLEPKLEPKPRAVAPAVEHAPLPAPAPQAPLTMKPAISGGKETKTMTPPDSGVAGTSTPPADAGTEAPKRRGGGLRKGQKINRRKKVTAGVSGLIFFIETEKGSNQFSLVNEPTMGDFLQLRVAGRRVIGALEAREL